MFFFVEQIFGENDDYTFGFHIANLSIFLKIILVLYPWTQDVN